MWRLVKVLSVALLVSACSHLASDPVSDNELDVLIKKSRILYVEELSREIVIFDDVAFGLGIPLRKYLNDDQAVNGKTILDLGAGSGVLSLIALKHGAQKAVATDINPNAVANAQYNAKRFGFEDKLSVRLVSLDNQGAYSVVGDNERFDFIVSNPPQHHEEPKTIYEYSYADPKLAFLRSILEGLKSHLTENGKGVFALYDQGLRLARQIADEQGLIVTVMLKTRNRNGIYYLVEIQRQSA